MAGGGGLRVREGCFSFGIRIFKDQLPISSDKIRKAIDLFNEMLKDNKNATDES